LQVVIGFLRLGSSCLIDENRRLEVLVNNSQAPTCATLSTTVLGNVQGDLPTTSKNETDSPPASSWSGVTTPPGTTAATSLSSPGPADRRQTSESGSGIHSNHRQTTDSWNRQNRRSRSRLVRRSPRKAERGGTEDHGYRRCPRHRRHSWLVPSAHHAKPHPRLPPSQGDRTRWCRRQSNGKILQMVAPSG